jgi:flagellar motor switch protein FliN/FliY
MPDHNSGAQWLAAEMAAQLRQVLESMTGEVPGVEFAPREIAEADQHQDQQEYLWSEQPLSPEPESFIWIGAGPETWKGIGGKVLRSAGVEQEDPESSRSTYLEIVNQALSGLASGLSSKVQQEISCLPGRQAPPGPEGGYAAFWFQIAFADVQLKLVGVFSRHVVDLAEPAPAANKAPAEPSAKALTAPPNPIDLLLDVELPVSISFGRAQLPLKDVIKLTTGSIVELNRSVSEPVEVIVNNCVIARGEVVVVEGNFGIRIKQVISRQERLRTLS